MASITRAAPTPSKISRRRAMMSAFVLGMPGPSGRSDMSAWIRVRVQMACVRIRLSGSVRAILQRIRFSRAMSISSSSMSSPDTGRTGIAAATAAFRSAVEAVSNGVPSAAAPVCDKTSALGWDCRPFATRDLWSPQAGGSCPELTNSERAYPTVRSETPTDAAASRFVACGLARRYAFALSLSALFAIRVFLS